MNIDDHIEYLLGLLSACRTVVIANDEGTKFSGAIALLNELERGIKALREHR